MKLQIASDLHLEYQKNNEYTNLITPSADILILAGDIGSLYKLNQLENFFNHYTQQFSYILYVLGNCEFYVSDEVKKYKTFNSLKDELKILEKKYDNLFVLDRSSIQIGDYLFTGCTLWSELKKSLPSNYKIKDMNTWKYNNLFVKDVEFIVKKSQYAKNRNLTHIVITHYVPLILNNDKNKSDLYMSDLSDVMDKFDIDTWICGHLHQNFYLKYNNTRIVSNQRGKPGSFCLDYSSEFAIEV